MTTPVLVAVPVVALVAVLLGVWLPVAGAVVAAVGVAAATVAVAAAAQAAQARRVAAHVNAWLGDDTGAAVEIGRSPGWAELEVAINALAGAYRRRGDKLRRERPWRRQLVEAIAAPALLFGGDDRLVAANRAALDLLGLADAATGVSSLEALGSATLAAATREARASGRPVEVRAEVAGRDASVTASPVGDEVLVMLLDRTRERQLTALRRDFVVNASHELKTPAASIQALAEGLELVVEDDPVKARHMVRRLAGQADRLSRLVNDLLDLRRLEERDPLDLEPVDVAALARTVVADLGDRAALRHITLSLHAPDTAVVAGVAGDVRLVVENLVANAIDYNRDGGTVDVNVTSGDGAVVVAVRDTGIGIASHDLRRVFERFYRVDTARSRAAGGTGLGLSIVRHAVDRHGGRVAVDSLLGEGSTFTVTLPVAPPA